MTGTAILGVFGISLNAFICAGGGILAWIGVSMLKSAQKDSNAGSSQVSKSKLSLAPLILFAASPGTITGVITIAAESASAAGEGARQSITGHSAAQCPARKPHQSAAGPGRQFRCRTGSQSVRFCYLS
jgi:small neutral amino acid transporter SnatA (MarC family)